METDAAFARRVLPAAAAVRATGERLRAAPAQAPHGALPVRARWVNLAWALLLGLGVLGVIVAVAAASPPLRGIHLPWYVVMGMLTVGFGVGFIALLFAWATGPAPGRAAVGLAVVVTVGVLLLAMGVYRAIVGTNSWGGGSDEMDRWRWGLFLVLVELVFLTVQLERARRRDRAAATVLWRGDARFPRDVARARRFARSTAEQTVPDAVASAWNGTLDRLDLDVETRAQARTLGPVAWLVWDAYGEDPASVAAGVDPPGPALAFARAAAAWVPEDWWTLETQAFAGQPRVRNALAFFSPTRSWKGLAKGVPSGWGCLVALLSIAGVSLPAVAAFLVVGSASARSGDVRVGVAGLLAGIAAAIALWGVLATPRRSFDVDPGTDRLVGLFHVGPSLVGGVISIIAISAGTAVGALGVVGFIADALIGVVMILRHRGVASTPATQEEAKVRRLEERLAELDDDERARIAADLRAALTDLEEHGILPAALVERAIDLPLGQLGRTMAPRDTFRNALYRR